MIPACATTTDLLERLCGIAREAGREIRRYQPRDVHTRHKPDRSPVTAADMAAEALIVRELASLDATVPVISEEFELPPPEVRQGWSRWWLVDPLDGTREFLAGNGEYTVNIALVEEREPVLGVVFAPALGLLYAAGRSLGAWRQTDGLRPERILSRYWPTGHPARIVESRSHPSPELERYLGSIPVLERIRLGSSLKFCRVAEGSADLYPRFGPVMEWDVAAGDCLYRNSAADGQRRSPLRYDAPDLRVPGFILGDEAP